MGVCLHSDHLTACASCPVGAIFSHVTVLSNLLSEYHVGTIDRNDGESKEKNTKVEINFSFLVKFLFKNPED